MTKKTYPCMAMNIDLTGSCRRPATKMFAGAKNPYNDKPVSINTVRLCGVCARRLHTGSKALVLQLMDGTKHTVMPGPGSGSVYVYQTLQPEAGEAR